ncbi:glycosyl hydrolase family 8 (plasmid) [Aliirhizobium terrae]|uniref:glycosyl hydrolase family 8 n=1 Tax=Terrirhizobium terrae TaxID=2926709 RepID=UPI002578B964|nr:glycosyl hydrolase family 8 [Rhizobium sp. CC-CFT758]WJH38210.1 glycosyl hydrolase family 8 [Rhizobium sp. CC-CFT758]
MRGIALILIGVLTALTGGATTRAQQGLVDPNHWQEYKSRFLDRSGRIVDNGNGGISHSEGQGYGLLLAYLSGSGADFEQIWSFTKTELLLRDDGLAVWRWDPKSDPHVIDTNNATDGDILIAYALALAGSAWNREEYLASASNIANAVLNKTVVVAAGRTILLPGVQGFGAADRKDGPVINPSYWIFEALPVMKVLAPSDKWDHLKNDGLQLIRALQIGPKKLPPEWASLKSRPKPADGFEPQFSYNAVRIPLYMMRAGINDPANLQMFLDNMGGAEGVATTIDLPSGQAVEPLTDPGYQIINHIMACVLQGARLPQTDLQFAPELYYPATLQLLGLALVKERHPDCL